MSWARFDDRYDDNRKIKRAWKAHPTSVGLHAMAVTYCARHETDGFVDLEWLEEKLPARKDRDAVCAVLVDADLFEATDGGYLIHDYLKFNPSRVQLESRREKDRLRKALAQNPDGLRTDSARNPDGIRLASDQSSRAPAGAGSGGDGQVVDEAPLAGVARQAAEILRQVPSAHVDDMGVENAMAAWPDRDPVQAARQVVTWMTDPNFRPRNAAKLLGDALSKQPPPTVSDERDATAQRRWAAAQEIYGGEAA